jgi:hypothetical protein
MGEGGVMGDAELLEERTERLDVGPRSWVRLGTVIATATFLFSAYSWLDARFRAVESAQAASSAALAEAMRRIEAAERDRWTRTDQRLFILELQVRNPGKGIAFPPVPEK